MKSRLLLIALLASFTSFGQEIMVNGESIGRYVNKSMDIKPFTMQLNNGNFVRKFKGHKVELYPNEEIERICKFNKSSNISIAVLMTLAAAIPIDGGGATSILRVLLIGYVMYVYAIPIKILNNIILRRYIKGKTKKQKFQQY